jgi:phage gp37-like protein
MGIKNVEDALLAKITDVLKVGGVPLVKTIDVLPSDWDNDMLRKFAAVAPCVLIAFSGGVVKDVGATDSVSVQAQWSVIAVTAHASGNAARRRGDSTRIGAFEICERLMPVLHGHTIENEGSMSLVALENLWSGEIEKQGIAAYGMRFELPMTFPFVLDDSALDDFETFDAKYDIPPFAGELEYASWLQDDFSTSKPEARDTVSLPQD